MDDAAEVMAATELFDSPALVAKLRDHARERGCYGMWVLTDADNAAALGEYRGAGGGAPSSQVVLEWDLSDGEGEGAPAARRRSRPSR
ncbi:MAG: hypothetical protein ACHQIG_04590 [Acidimicrobiia bacterium]